MMPRLTKISSRFRYDVLADVLLSFADKKTLALFLKIIDQPLENDDYKSLVIEVIKGVTVGTITASIQALLGF